MNARAEPRSNLPESSGERYIQNAVLAAAGQNDELVVLDVGANKGQWTSQLIGLAPEELRESGRLIIHAFEPVYASRVEFLDATSRISGNECCLLHTTALSDFCGEQEFAIWGETAGTNTLSFDDVAARRAIKVLQVQTQTLDNFLQSQSLSHVNLLKIDAEGHDYNILEGSVESLLEGCVDVVQFEYSHRWIYSRKFLRDVFLLIEDKPYDLYRVCRDRLELLSEWHPELERFFDANFALVHPRVVHWFTVYRGSFDNSNTYSNRYG